ncbi:MAG: DnaA regulatory inactivator Hda [Burkholderiales bacterium]
MEQLLLELTPAPAPSLENFHVGSNGAVIAALHGFLADRAGVIFLWGAPGCGRTHLLRAIAKEAASRGLKARYQCGDDATNLSDTDFLALDDVESLDADTQIATFDAFNRIRSHGGGVIASSKLPPADLTLREDLRTRLGSGVVMQVRALSEEEKRAVLVVNAQQRGLNLGAEISDYLLAHFERDLGSLIAAIDALDRYSLRTKRPITLPLLRETLKLKAAQP